MVKKLHFSDIFVYLCVCIHRHNILVKRQSLMPSQLTYIAKGNLTYFRNSQILWYYIKKIHKQKTFWYFKLKEHRRHRCSRINTPPVLQKSISTHLQVIQLLLPWHSWPERKKACFQEQLFTLLTQDKQEEPRPELHVYCVLQRQALAKFKEASNGRYLPSQPHVEYPQL